VANKPIYVEFVDFGGATVGDLDKMAGETMVFMVVGLLGKENVILHIS
jgi:hypothetical protein